MSSTVNSTVFKIFLPILIGLAIFATLDSIKVESLDPNVNSLRDALDSFSRQIELGNTEAEQQNLDYFNDDNVAPKARGKLREAVILNIMTSQHCGLTLKPEEADNIVYNQDEFSNGVIEGLKQFYEGSSGDASSEIYYPDYEGLGNYYEKNGDENSDGPYAALRDDDVGISCAGADQLSANTLGVSKINENEGNDMEGKFGRISFEVENNFTIEDTRTVGFNFPNLLQQNKEGVQTRLLSGAKTVAFAPEGCGDRSFYNGLVRMQNVPVIKSEEANPCNKAKLVRNEVDLSYVMCRGATGYIETNVGDPEEVEAESDNKAEFAESTFNFVGGQLAGDQVSDIPLIGGKLENAADAIFDVASNELLDLETDTRMLIRDGATSCIEDIETTNSKVLGSDLEGLSRCETENLGDSGNWNGLNVECSVVEETITNSNGGGTELYNTVWVNSDEGSKCEEQFDITDSFELESLSEVDSQSDVDVYYDGSLNIQGLDNGVNPGGDEEGANILYKLGYYEHINEVSLNIEANEKTYTQYILETSSGTYTVESMYYPGSEATDQTPHIEHTVTSEGMEKQKIGEKDPDAVEDEIRFNLDQGKIITSVGEKEVDFEGRPLTLKINSNHFADGSTSGGRGITASNKIGEIIVDGEVNGCS